MRVALDCDGVLCNFTGATLAWVNERRGTCYTIEDVTGWDILESLELGSMKDDFYQHATKPGWCRSLEPIPGAVEAVRLMSQEHDVVIVTSPFLSGHWIPERTDWLWAHFGIKSENVVFAQKKHHVHADLLVDDSFENCKEWARHGGLSLLWDAPYNQHSQNSWQDGMVRVGSWDEVYRHVDWTLVKRA